MLFENPVWKIIRNHMMIMMQPVLNLKIVLSIYSSTEILINNDQARINGSLNFYKRILKKPNVILGSHSYFGG